jgi:hypothetical protein
MMRVSHEMRKTVSSVLPSEKTPHCRTSAGNRNSCFGGTY